MLLDVLWDPPSAVFVFGSLLGIAFTASDTEQGLRLVNDLALPIGLIGLVIGLVGTLQNVSDYDALPSSVAVAHLPLIYALVAYGFTLVEVPAKTQFLNFYVRKFAGSTVFVLFVLWAVAASSGFKVFFLIDGLVFIAVGIVFFVVVDRVLKRKNSSGWTIRLLGIALTCFACALLGMLANLGERRAIGPAAALALLGVFYALVLVVMGRVVVPEKMLDAYGQNRTGVLALVLPFLLGVFVLFASMATATLYVK